DAFISLIHNNDSLSDVDKLQYLKGALTKEAQDIVGAIAITNANYVVAWDLLKTRYDNQKLIVKSYLDQLFAIPVMKKESYDLLIALIDGFDRSVKMSARMGVQTEGWSELLAYMLCARLDPSTLKQWETHHRSTEVPKYDDVLQFLRGHASVLQATQQEKARNVDSSQITTKPKARNSYVHSVRTESAATSPVQMFNLEKQLWRQVATQR
uniref:Uncharacterized protein n=1 Tax=Anopheles epiroticus TaxID=199890 RepID=A0A182PWW2_9DIPT